MVGKIADVLIERDGMTREAANQLVEQARDDALEQLAQGVTPWDICEEWFGLEPDYLDELIFSCI